MGTLRVQNLAFVLISLTLSVLAGEAMLRVLMDEGGYLLPEISPHPALGHAILPGSGGHDAWGFRNSEVPDQVTILAVGDSQTYGYSATRAQSWPALLSDISGASTYNLALGGYGPREYLYLIEEKAALLHPQVILIGFYFGNDLVDHTDINPLEVDLERDRTFGRARDWLAMHSMAYQMVKILASDFVAKLRFEESVANLKHGSYVLDGQGLKTVLTPNLRLKALDQSIAENQSGLHITMDTFEKIQQQCDNLDSRCIFTLIPTKESVYWPIADKLLTGNGHDETATLVESEAWVRARLIQFLDRNSLEYIDLLADMRAAITGQDLYPNSQDGHPTGAGYRVIADAVWDHLRNQDIFDPSKLSGSTQ